MATGSTNPIAMAATMTPEGTPTLAAPGARPAETPSALARLAARENRLFLTLLAVLFLLAIALLAIIVMLPLKSVTPVLIERDTTNGVVRSYSVSTSSYAPSQNDLKYFLGKYVTWTYTAHRMTTEADLETARQHFTRGKAVTQFDAFLERERPIARLRADPGYTRRVEIQSISIFKDAAVVKFTSVEQGSADREAKRTRLTASLQFSTITPTDDEKLILTNPAGLYITDLGFERDIE